MIDLSHLTEEEQGAIMTVLRRDVELKKAEEERVRRLEKILNSGSQSDSELKYLSGEWFYEAKSRRHMDKIHGSEIILASMKQRKAAGLDGSLRIERSKVLSNRASDIDAPQKPARCLEALQPLQMNNAENKNLYSRVRSPRMPRHNPFNRASFTEIDPPENTDMSAGQDQESPKTELISPLNYHPAAESGQTTGGSVTSEGSSVGFRPVPKKRSFLSRRSQSESNGLGLDTQVGSVGIVPAPRRSLKRESSGSSNQSCPNNQDSMIQKSEAPLSNQTSQLAQPCRSADEISQHPLCDRLSFSSSQHREQNVSSTIRDRPATCTTGDVFTERENPLKMRGTDDQTQREHARLNTFIVPTSSIQDSDRENSSVATALRHEELSFTHSAADPDPPVLYDLTFIDRANQQMHNKSNQKHAFKLSTQATSPTGDDEDSIAKVLDWFSRSTDSSDWLNTEDDPVVAKGSGKHVETSKLRNDAGKIISDRKKESGIQRQTSEAKELRATDRPSKKNETEEEGMTNTKERIQIDEVKDDDDEWQPPKISHLKSFWEKSNTGPKILISKSINNKEQKTEEGENTKKPHRVPDMPSGVYNEKGVHENYASNHVNEREQQLSRQKDTEDSVHVDTNQQEGHLFMNVPTKRKDNDQTPNSDYLRLRFSPKEAYRRGLDTEILYVTRLGPEPRPTIQSRVSKESESFSPACPDPQLHSISQFQGTSQQEELVKTISQPQLNASLQTRESPILVRNNSYMDDKIGGNVGETTSKAQMRKGSSEDVKKRESEDQRMQSNESHQRNEDAPNADRSCSTRSNRHGLPQESTAERIKQLRSFWEQERSKSMFYTGKSKTFGDDKVTRNGKQTKLHKRFTKSEYDLRSIGNESDSDREHSDRNHHNFTVIPLNQRIKNVSPTLSMSRTQFNTLREFWDEATSDAKGSLSSDKHSTSKRKDPMGSQPQCCDAEIFCTPFTVEKTRPAAIKPSPPLQNRSKSPQERQKGSRPRAANDSKNTQSVYTTAESKRSSKDSIREKKSTKPQSSSGKQTGSPKSRERKDSFGNISGCGNSLRRATSMLALSGPDEKDLGHLKMDTGPVQTQIRKQRQNAEKAAVSRRSSEEAETLSPRARAFVPRDYRHYLGITDKTSVHASLAPAVADEGSESKSDFEFDLSCPVRASTPVSSEELYSRKGSKTSQHPLWANCSGSDTGQESSVSSTSETWSISRSSRNRENDDVESHSLVRKALMRAEARPKNQAKSMEDITASLSPRQERQDPTHVSSIPSPSSSLFSDPDHLKKMSKSVPSFLEREDADRDTDFTSEDGYHKLLMGRSMTNLTSNSSGNPSVSSLNGSVMTIYSGDFGNIEVQGNIQFSINYIQRLREFHIFVAECRDLAAVDQKRGRSDPYVKSYLIPDKANLGKRKTSVKKKTLNPTFNEILRYRVRMEYLKTQTLILSVWHHDTFGRNSFLGEVDVDLTNWDFDHTQMNYLALKARSTPTLGPSKDRGEMRLAIRFLPQIIRSEGTNKDFANFGEIHVWVKECKNLPLIRTTIDPYVKCFVLPDTSRKSRQKTRVLRRTVDPVFNHTMVYDGIRDADLTEACVELSVWDRDRLASHLMGGLRLGSGTGKSYGTVVDWMDSTSFEVALWERMMASPTEWVEGVLPLRMLNSAKTAFK